VLSSLHVSVSVSEQDTSKVMDGMMTVLQENLEKACNCKITEENFLNGQGRIKASSGPGAVPNAGPLQTYNQVTTTTNCGPPELRARVLQHP